MPPFLFRVSDISLNFFVKFSPSLQKYRANARLAFFAFLMIYSSSLIFISILIINNFHFTYN